MLADFNCNWEVRNDRSMELSGGRKRSRSMELEHCNQANVTNVNKHTGFSFPSNFLSAIKHLEKRC
jgi:hypothetical protein